MKNMEDLLREALSPAEEPAEEINRTIFMRIKEETMNQPKTNHKKRLPMAAAIAVAILVLSSATIYAAWQYFTPESMAREFSDDKLSKAFTGEDAVLINETQSCGGYDVTLLGIVSGSRISDYLTTINGEIRDDRSYIAIAISHTDGTPMPGMQDDDFNPTEIFVSPYIKGFRPMDYNAYTMGGGFSCFVKDGVQYRIMETDNVEVFADKGVYIGASEGMAYNANAYLYDDETGELRRNESFDGLNALFLLPFDTSRANTEKAEKLLELWAQPEDE